MSLRDEVREIQAQRAALDERLVNLEKQIFALEGTYLEETATGGNILRGWDGYLSTVAQPVAVPVAAAGASASAPLAAAATNAPSFVPADRLFSLSSSSSDRNVALPSSSSRPQPGTAAAAAAAAAAELH